MQRKRRHLQLGVRVEALRVVRVARGHAPGRGEVVVGRLDGQLVERRERVERVEETREGACRVSSVLPGLLNPVA